jgi:TetR/AcrR family transcriptional regulator
MNGVIMTRSTQRPDTRTAILNEAVSLFARQGYDKVSMRDIAQTVGIGAPALYNHFKDKQSLYLEVIAHAFKDKALALSIALEPQGHPVERLTRFVECLCEMIGNDTDFRKLIQREVLDGDETRLRVLARRVFIEQFQAISELAQELNPTCDAHMLALSIAGLVIHHFEFGPLRRFFPGNRAEHEDPHYIADYVVQLLLHGILPDD